ncbi:serine protease [Chryseobacterium indologenes]|uniref:Serine protease n=1 Tax=Chryseobacterium indologenes TaxID=253 RepID=A0A0N0IW24_CHRID|nr:serine protease [Chryseobacterium indologenes]KPE51023.1 hypothetical protein AOB46_12615 [Chryseobacterium indologenes]
MLPISKDNLAYPMYVEINQYSGTAFLMEYKNRIYLISAKHVFVNMENNKFLSQTVLVKYSKKELNSDNYFLSSFTMDMVILSKNSKVIFDEKNDIIAIDIFENEMSPKHANFTEGIVESNPRPGVFFVVPGASILTSNLVQIGHDVGIFGYPTSLQIQNDKQFDFDLPLVRKGMVSQIYNEKGYIVLDCQVHPGNSGGPVFQYTQHSHGLIKQYLIGILIQFIPHNTKLPVSNNYYGTITSIYDAKNSGYSVAVNMDYVIATLERFNRQ